MKNKINESGQVIILTALFMTVLLGFLALAIDVAMLFRAREMFTPPPTQPPSAPPWITTTTAPFPERKPWGKADAAANGVTADGVKGATSHHQLSHQRTQYQRRRMQRLLRSQNQAAKWNCLYEPLQP